MTRAKATVVLFVVASMLSFLAAVIPMLKGGQLNVTYLGSGFIMLVIAIASAKRARTGNSG